MLYIDPRGERLLVCCCGYTGYVTEDACPACKSQSAEAFVLCADANHNSTEGCGNSDCWKFNTNGPNLG